LRHAWSIAKRNAALSGRLWSAHAESTASGDQTPAGSNP
jgi:hypothetical protein